MNFTDITVLHSLAGVLLRMLQGDPDLSSITHVFVDEVHERSVDSDIVRFFFFLRARL
jgi:ATP-dependent RNA helicase DHX57